MLQVEIFNKTPGNGEEEKESDPNMIQLRLSFLDPKKRKTQHKENEAIQFSYNMDKDVPEEVVWEMVFIICRFLFGFSAVVFIQNQVERFLQQNKLNFMIVQVKSGIAGEADVKVITRQMKDRISQFKAERQRKMEETAKDEAAKEAQQHQGHQPGLPQQVSCKTEFE